MNNKKLNYLFNAVLNLDAVEGLKNICNTFKISKKDVLYLIFYTLNDEQIKNIIVNNVKYKDLKNKYRRPKNFFGASLQVPIYTNLKLKKHFELLADDLQLNKNNFVNLLLEHFKNIDNLQKLS